MGRGLGNVISRPRSPVPTAVPQRVEPPEVAEMAESLPESAPAEMSEEVAAAIREIMPEVDNPNIPVSATRMPEEEVVDGSRTRYFDPDELQTDPQSFQYKALTDEAGVSEKLRDVNTWDQTLANVSFVWERADGQQFRHGRTPTAGVGKAAEVGGTEHRASLPGSGRNRTGTRRNT